ncbi:MAG TPA: helix-turn-helix domain-containing protein [Nocardioidaceae bacterium]|nr:helix-turn-helix domain-containing protein [Nocardioidaceae bacterium]
MSSLPRQSLNSRQMETVEKLFAAAGELLEEVGHEQMTVRLVASRAGVSPATAYTYFASKEHLFAELFWRMLVSAPGPKLTGRTPTSRMQQMAAYLADLIADNPALAAAVNKSLLGSDPEVQRLRLAIGGKWVERFREAIGEDADPDVLLALAFALSGALLQAGMGILAYDELAGVLQSTVAVIMRGNE